MTHVSSIYFLMKGKVILVSVNLFQLPDWKLWQGNNWNCRYVWHSEYGKSPGHEYPVIKGLYILHVNSDLLECFSVVVRTGVASSANEVHLYTVHLLDHTLNKEDLIFYDIL